MYSLHLYRGIGEEFELTYPEAGTIRFRVVGLLSNSILQGSLLIGETDFVQRFPNVSGYRYFSDPSRPPARRRQSQPTLEDRLSDQGFDAVSAHERLEDLLAVQNTYLSTFQSLGALGLLLGTFGSGHGPGAERHRAARRTGAAAGVRFPPPPAGLAGDAGELSPCWPAGCSLDSQPPWSPRCRTCSSGGASIPLLDLTLLLAVVLVVGCLSSLASVRATLQAPILAALREE